MAIAGRDARPHALMRIALVVMLAVMAQSSLVPTADASAARPASVRAASAGVSGAYPVSEAKTVRLTKRQKRSVVKWRARVAAIARTQQNFTGLRVSARGTVLRLYGVGHPSPGMQQVIRKARAHSKLRVVWKGSAHYRRAELAAAARTARKDHRIRKVRIRPDKGGYLEIVPKRRYRIALLRDEMFLSQVLQIEVPSVIRPSSGRHARPLPDRP